MNAKGRAVAVALMLQVAAAGAAAGEGPPSSDGTASSRTRGLLRLEGGRYGLHRSDRGSGGSVKLGAERGRVSVDLGLTLVPGEGASFGAVDGSLRFALCRGCPIAPFLGAGVGLMGEEGFGGPWFGALAGVEARVSRGSGIYLVGRLATHGGQSGPDLIGVGYAVRLGGR